MLFEKIKSEEGCMVFHSNRSFITQFQEAVTGCGCSCTLYPVDEGTGIRIVGSNLFHGRWICFEGVRSFTDHTDMVITFTSEGRTHTLNFPVFSDSRFIGEQLKSAFEYFSIA